MESAHPSPEPWHAPERTSPLGHTLSLPGSKSLTNRELILAALADGPSTIKRPLHSRDTALMVEALRALGATITAVEGSGDFGPDLLIHPIAPGSRIEGATIDCGLAGTVMRFIPPLAAVIAGEVTFDGDPAAKRRPMASTIDALGQLGVEVEHDGRHTLPFRTRSTGVAGATEVRIDASSSSQFVSGLLLVAPRLPAGLNIIHTGESLPSLPHIEMTLHCLRQRGVAVSNPERGVWSVEPGPIAALDVEIEPDLSNAAPFLAAAMVVGGRVTLSGWPDQTTQVGGEVPALLEALGARIERAPGSVTVDGGLGWRSGETIRAVDLDLSQGGELAPTIVTLCCLADGPSRITGIGHLRGHETDRLQALVENIQALGGHARELPTGIEVTPASLHGGVWKAFDDHRMATSGALIGLGVPGVLVDDIACTSKTLPEFPALWIDLVDSAAP